MNKLGLDIFEDAISVWCASPGGLRSGKLSSGASGPQIVTSMSLVQQFLFLVQNYRAHLTHHLMPYCSRAQGAICGVLDNSWAVNVGSRMNVFCRFKWLEDTRRIQSRESYDGSRHSVSSQCMPRGNTRGQEQCRMDFHDVWRMAIKCFWSNFKCTCKPWSILNRVNGELTTM